MTAVVLLEKLKRNRHDYIMSDLEDRIYRLSEVVAELSASVKLTARENEHIAEAIKQFTKTVESIKPDLEAKISTVAARVQSLEDLKREFKAVSRGVMIVCSLLLLIKIPELKDFAVFVFKMFGGS